MTSPLWLPSFGRVSFPNSAAGRLQADGAPHRRPEPWRSGVRKGCGHFLFLGARQGFRPRQGLVDGSLTSPPLHRRFLVSAKRLASLESLPLCHLLWPCQWAHAALKINMRIYVYWSDSGVVPGRTPESDPTGCEFDFCLTLARYLLPIPVDFPDITSTCSLSTKALRDR